MSGPDLDTYCDHPVLDGFARGFVFAYDARLRVRSAGGRGLAESGVGAELVGADIAAVITGLDEYALAQFASVLDGASAGTEFRLGRRTYAADLVPVLDAAEKAIGGVAYAHDVTSSTAADQTLRESEERFRLMFDGASVGIALVELDGRWKQVNEATCRLTGYPREQLLAMTFQDITHPADLDLDLDLVGQLVRGERSHYQLEKRYLTASGRTLWALLDVSLIRSPDGEPLYFISEIQDISDRKEKEDALAEAMSFQEAVLAVVPDVIHVREVASGHNTWISRSLSHVLGYSPAAFGSFGSEAERLLIPQEDQEIFAAANQRSVRSADGEVTALRYRVRHADGSIRWMSERLTPFRRDAAGTVTHLLAVSRDVTRAVEMEQRFEHASLHDDLTGLANRRLVYDRLSHTDDEARVAVLFCDIDGFKTINDTYGHDVGDAALREIAQRLEAASRDIDTVGRVGGDEFVIIQPLAPGDDPDASAAAVTARIAELMARPLDVLPGRTVLTVSIGTAVAHGATEALRALRHADAAMYQGRSRRRTGATASPALTTR